MAHLVSEGFQTILFLFFFFLLLKLLCFSLLPAMLQHICPKQHPTGAKKVRTSDLKSPFLPLPLSQPTLPITPDTAGLPAVMSFVELLEYSFFSHNVLIFFSAFLDSYSESCLNSFLWRESTPKQCFTAPPR